MQTNNYAARWAVSNPTVARGRLLTAGRALRLALYEVDRMLGAMEMDSAIEQRLDLTGAGLDTSPILAHHLELGMDETQRQLLHAVHALDMK